MTTLEALIRSAPHIPALMGLRDLPIGGWGATDEARRRFADALPCRAARSYSVPQAIEALYETDGPYYVARSIDPS